MLEFKIIQELKPNTDINSYMGYPPKPNIKNEVNCFYKRQWLVFIVFCINQQMWTESKKI